MLSVKGVYTGRSVKLLAKLNKRPNTPVIITFLDEDDTEQYDTVRLQYEKLAKDFDFGLTPGEDYAQEIMSDYLSSLSRI